MDVAQAQQVATYAITEQHQLVGNLAYRYGKTPGIIPLASGAGDGGDDEGYGGHLG